MVIEKAIEITAMEAPAMVERTERAASDRPVNAQKTFPSNVGKTCLSNQMVKKASMMLATEIRLGRNQKLLLRWLQNETSLSFRFPTLQPLQSANQFAAVVRGRLGIHSSVFWSISPAFSALEQFSTTKIPRYFNRLEF